MKVSNKFADDVSFTHIKVGSTRVCYMFSGSGYTYEKPLFYYSTMLMLENNIDVIHVHYQYEADFLQKPIEVITERMVADINLVLNAVGMDSNYSETMFLGKSLGSIPIANHLMKTTEYQGCKMVLLTPLLKFEEVFVGLQQGKNKGLLVIGDVDPHYDAKKLEQLQSSNLEMLVIKNSNHSLDIVPFETSESIFTLSTVIESLKRVITS